MLGRSGENPYQRRRTFLWVVSLLMIVSVLLILVSRSDNAAFEKPRAVIDGLMAPIVGVVSKPIRGAENIGKTLKERSTAIEQNKTLRAEVARLQDVEIRADAMQIKINRFEEILQSDIIDDIPTNKIPARAVTEAHGPFVRSALLNVGAIHGVEKGHAVMTTRGLYGHIIRRGQNSSRALLVNDLNSRIAVMSKRSGARAILTGDNSNRPVLAFIAPEADWKIGDRVVTSGDEGVLPMGLPVGVVESEVADRFVISVFSQSEPVDWVWVYPFTPITPPEDKNENEEPEAVSTEPVDPAVGEPSVDATGMDP